MRGQMEMIGLAFVVVLIVMGLLVYVALSGASNNTVSAEIEEADMLGKTLETAMLETTIPSCDYTLATALERCMTRSDLLCGDEPVCDATLEAWDEMLRESLGDATTSGSESYRAIITQEDDQFKDFIKEPFPDECNEDSTRYAAPSQPLYTSQGDLLFTIQFC